MIPTQLQLLFLHELSREPIMIIFKNMLTNTVCLFTLLLGVNSCKQKADAPSYLRIENFSIKTNILTQGSASQNITEAFVYIDDQIAGVYHLPALVPLTVTGSHSVKIGPAIIENAIASNIRVAYTFLGAYDTVLNFETNKSITLQPASSYRSTVKFELIEDFESPSLQFEKGPSNTLDTLIRDSLLSDNIEPGHCALFDMPNGFLMEYLTKSAYSLPSSSSSETFLEINYKSELALAIGLYVSGTPVTKTGVVTLNPKATWSKAYINLTSVVSVKPPGTKFKLFISSLNLEGSNKKVFVDNLKIIHFE